MYECQHQSERQHVLSPAWPVSDIFQDFAGWQNHKELASFSRMNHGINGQNEEPGLDQTDVKMVPGRNVAQEVMLDIYKFENNIKQIPPKRSSEKRCVKQCKI